MNKHDPDHFDADGFADYLSDAIYFLLMVCLLAVAAMPWWLP
jgi:hypothetical protein